MIMNLKDSVCLIVRLPVILGTLIGHGLTWPYANVEQSSSMTTAVCHEANFIP